MGHRPRFSGPVQAGRAYILVDDLSTMGGTFAELRAYIEQRGGRVVDTTALAAVKFGDNIAITPQTLLALRAQYGDAPLREWLHQHGLYGGEPGALTEAEARWLLGAKGLDAAGDRISAARLRAGGGRVGFALRAGPEGGQGPTGRKPLAAPPRTIEALATEWWRNLERIAPGLAKEAELRFGESDALVEQGLARRDELTGEEEAARVRDFKAKKEIFYLFERALRQNTPDVTRLNLQHEMGHAFWDTLDRHTQLRLQELFDLEIQTQTGPLFDAEGNLRDNVALGATEDVQEWFAERLAHANDAWAKRRIGTVARGDTLIATLAAAFRRLLVRMRELVERHLDRNGYEDVLLRNFRLFLDQGTKWTGARPRARPILPGVTLDAAPRLVRIGGLEAARRAYHGTPHEVDKFSTSKIGTGEGAQVYGWGLYFAEAKNIAAKYRDALAKHELLDADGKLIAKGGNIEALANMQKDYAGSRLVRSGNLYTVELLGDAEDFLDWDKPLSEQSEKVKAAVSSLLELNKDIAEDSAGSDIYQILSIKLGSEKEFGFGALAWKGRVRNDKAASDALAKAGVKGIRYLDEGSRRAVQQMIIAAEAQEATHNYVIFDEADVEIIEKNGRRLQAQFARRGRQVEMTPELAAKTVPVVPAARIEGTGAQELRQAARQAAAEWLGEPIRNDDTGAEIVVSGKSLNHGFSHKGIEHIRAVPALPELIRTAVHIATEPHSPASEHFKAVHRYAAALDIEGRIYRVKLTTKERANGQQLYDHEATEIETPDGKLLRARPDESAGTRPSSGANVTVGQLFGGVKPGERVQFARRANSDAEFDAALRNYDRLERERDRQVEQFGRADRALLEELSEARMVLENSWPGWREAQKEMRAETEANETLPTEPEQGVGALDDEGRRPVVELRLHRRRGGAEPAGSRLNVTY